MSKAPSFYIHSIFIFIKEKTEWENGKCNFFLNKFILCSVVIVDSSAKSYSLSRGVARILGKLFLLPEKPSTFYFRACRRENPVSGKNREILGKWDSLSVEMEILGKTASWKFFRVLYFKNNQIIPRIKLKALQFKILCFPDGFFFFKKKAPSVFQA